MNNENLDSFLTAWLSAKIREVVRNELNNFFSAKDNGTIQSVHDNIDNLRNEWLKNLKQDVDSLHGKVDNLLAFLYQKDKDNSAAVKLYQNQVNKLSGELSDAKQRYEQLRKEANAEVDRLNDEIGGLNTKLSEAKKSYDLKSRELQNANEVIDQLKYDNRQIYDDLTEKKNELSAKEDELSEANQKLSRTKDKLNEVLESEQSKDEKLREWTSSANIYAPVRDAITRCSTFSKIVSDYGLDDMSEAGLLKYAQAMGTTDNFVVEIWKTAEKVKIQTKELMTVDEAAVYNALNQAYCKIWRIDHDIFTLPSGQKVTEIFQKTKFDFSTSLYLIDPRNRILAYTTGIYVPILMGKENRLPPKAKAYVDAANR